MGRSPKTQSPSEGNGVLVRISKEAVTILRRLGGFLEKPMSNVASEMIIEHGKPKLMKLMAQENEAFKREEQTKK